MKQPKQFGVYKIICNKSRLIYIGGTSVSFDSRRRKHWQKLRARNHENDLMQQHWDIHGPSQFSFEILEVVTDKSIVRFVEKIWLDKYLSDGNVELFNLSTSTTGGNTITNQYVKDKHRIGLIKSYTPELLAVRSAKGKEITKEHLEKLKAAKSTDKWKDAHLAGVRRLAKDPKWLSSMKKVTELKKVKVKTDKGEIFNSVTEAAAATGASRANIRACINGKISTSKGRKWEYLK